MRILALVVVSLLLLPGLQRVHAQDPGAQQDAVAAREKLLKAADQIEMIQTNSEATRSSVDGLKADIAKLRDENSALKQQVSELQAAFEKAEAARAKERQVLLDEVSKMVASGKGSAAPKSAKKKDMPASISAVSKPAANDAALANSTDSPQATEAPTAASTSASATDTAPAHAQKGYYHVVESGETLTLICSAYRQNGVNVTIAEIQKANGLTDKSVLKVGQKLFIPKPGA